MRLTQNYRTSHKIVQWLSIGLLSVLSFSAKSAIPASCEGVKEGLIACYPFDGNTNDLSGKNYHGAAKNVTYVAGQAGQAAHFDGKTGYIEIASNKDLNSPQITFATWVKPSTGSNNKGVDHSIIFNKELQYELAIFEDNYGTQVKRGELSFAFESNWDWMGTSTSLPPNKFVHLALTYTKDNMAKFYVDGKLVKEQKYARGLITNDLCVRIGARGCPSSAAVYFFNGDMDEFRIYNRDLSETEIKQLAGVETKPVEVTTNPIPASCEGIKDGLVACYPFDGSANDLSGKNYHGKVAGNLTYVQGKAGGQAAHFDGSNYVEVADTPDLNSPQMSFTAWVKPLSLERPSTDTSGSFNSHSIFNKEPQHSLSLFGESYMKDRIKVGELGFAFNPNWLYMPTNYTPSLNQFMHVVLTFDQNNTGKLYINGNLVKEEQYGKPLKTPAEVEAVIHMNVSNLRIGASTCLPILSRKCSSPAAVHSLFNGDIDEFRVYNRSLSELEVKQLAGIEPIKPVEQPVVKYTVSVTKTGEGKGEVQAEDLKLTCGPSCKYDYPSGSTVKLMAYPFQKNFLKEWTGDCSPANQGVILSANKQDVTITVDKAKNCTAVFMPEQAQQAAPTPPPSNAPSQLCANVTGTYGQDHAGYCNDYTFEGNNVPCVINKNGEIIAGDCAQDQLNPKPLANNMLAYSKRAFVGKSFSATTPRCDSSVEFSAENKVKAPSNMAFLCVRYEKTAGSNSFYYGLAFVNNAQILSYKLETTPDKCVGTCSN